MVSPAIIMEETVSKRVLIIGVTGGIGGAAAHAFHAHGWAVVALHRDPVTVQAKRGDLPPVTWHQGDAMNEADVVAAAADVDVIVHAANPPGYRNWRGLALPMLTSSIAAARAAGARLVLPGNLYNFAPEDGPLVSEATRQRPRTRKGAIRVEMETTLRRAATEDGLRVLVLRAGDFFGGRAPASWFQNVLVKPGRRLTSVTYPGRRDAGHAWAYLPDLAETMVQLVEREAELEPFAVYHFGGHYVERGIDMAEAVCAAAGLDPDRSIRRFPWPMVYLTAPFVRLFREMLEMRYLWQVPVKPDNRKLVALLGAEPHTPLPEAVRGTLAALKCV